MKGLPPEVRQRVLVEWNNTSPADARMGSVPDMFAQSVQHSPDAVAVLDYKTSLSYRALDDRSTHLAWQLISAGVKPGDKVAVCTERTVDVVIALLAILKAGAAYLPIEASYPSDRIKFMLNDAGVTLAVADDANRKLFGAQLQVMSTAPAAAVMRAPLPTVHAKDLAYVIYTSGSTGTPKGALIEHAGIVRLVCDVSYVKLDRDQVLLHAAPVAFDASTFEIWGALLTGGRVVIHRERLPTASGLAATIHDRGVTTAWLTAGLYNAVIDEAPEALAPLSQLLIGGEALSVAHVKRGLDLLPNTTIINGYGPTECTTFTTTLAIPRPLPGEWTAIPIGKPIRDTTCFVLDANREPVAVGEVGELYVGGAGVARGYLAREDLTKERFINHELAKGGRLYRTGDLVRYRPDGVIEYVGRTDNQIKIRGFRIELSEIESVLSQHPALNRVVVSVYEPRPSDKRIIAHYSVRAGETVDVNELKSFCARTLPDYMVPSAALQVKEFPLTSNGKVDLRALPLPEAKLATQTHPTSEREKQIATVLAEVLGLPAIGNDDHFFDLGGSSLLALRAIARMESRFGLRFSVTDLFDRPTPRQLAVDASSEASAPLDEPSMLREPVAIIGMAGRFPGADNIDTLWKNLCAGVEALTTFTREELHPLAQQIAAQEANYVSKRGVLSDIKRFDAAFFNIHAREAELMDPQQRLLLETAWATLENAGYVPESVPGRRIGAFAGAYNNSYFTHHVSKRPDLIERLGAFQVMLANEKDYVATRLAHKLDLRGPALSIHTACSTSLVAIAQAVESLWLGSCDLAIAGGVSLTCPPNSGYVYQEGGMLSADGHTRSFNEGSTGTTFGDGVAMVALKRVSAAQRDGDTIYAVIHGTGVNNDGGEKASFTAPSTRGQKEAIRRAQRTAHVNARVMSYIEAHGTATPIGDPIEVEALREAFAHDTKDTQFCGIGSVKSNLGHLVAAAGATGLIKTALALHHEKIPATIGFEQPNRAIDFSTTPFRVISQLTPWPRSAQPRFAGVSSFGVGGTNAHLVVGEAPQQQSRPASTDAQLLLLSARTDTALRNSEKLLAESLNDSTQDLADVSFTLARGRRAFKQRRYVVARNATDASAAVLDSKRGMSRAVGKTPAVVFMFPGQGSQQVGMGQALYQRHPVFREALDECSLGLRVHLGVDLVQDLLYPAEGSTDDSNARLRQTKFAQPALFAVEYALARLWLSLGVEPDVMLGHSIGEFCCAVLAGVFTLQDALRLVAQRGALMQALPVGAMLTVKAAASALEAKLTAGLSIASINSKNACVVAGPTDAIAALEQQLLSEKVACRQLQTSHAFHSAMMEPAVGPFTREVEKCARSAPKRRFISTATGKFITDEQAQSPAYWASHLRDTVRFADAVETACQMEDVVLLEVGPRTTLSQLARPQLRDKTKQGTWSTLCDASEGDAEWVALLEATGKLWVHGASIAMEKAFPKGHRVPLPTYPFEGDQHWVEAIATFAPAPSEDVSREPSEHQIVVPVMEPSMSRISHIQNELRSLFEDVSGVEFGPNDGGQSFIELGLDSLFLTQVATAIQKKFEVKLTFRQLMEQYTSLDELVGYLDGTLPSHVGASAPAAAQPQTAPPAAAQAQFAAAPVMPGGMQNTMLQMMMQQQMMMTQLMGQMLGTQVPSLPPQPQAPQPIASAPSKAITSKPAEAQKLTVVPTTVLGDTTATPTLPAGFTLADAPDIKKPFGAIAKISLHGVEVTPKQKQRIDAFIARYNEKTKTSKSFTQKARARHADPRVVTGFRPAVKELIYPIVVKKSAGPRVWDLDNNEYVDCLNGFGCNLFGWQPKFVTDAVIHQLQTGHEIGPQSPLSAECAELFCEFTGTDRAAFCNTGSEAVMGCMRIARTVTGRSKIAIFSGSYHGIFDEVIVRGTKKLRAIPAAPGIMPNTSENVLVLDYGTDESMRILREHAHELAAVLVEPVQSRRPDFQPKAYLEELRTLTTQHGCALIFDEVITGFRSHPGGAQAHFSVKADLASYGKVVGGGLPVGVIAGKREWMDALDGGHWQFGDDSMPTVGVTYFAGTFVRHPLALAAVKAVLTHLKSEGPELQQRMNRITADFAATMNAHFKKVGAPLEIRYFSSLWKTFYLEDQPFGDLLFYMMRDRGVHIYDGFPCFWTTSHSEADIALVTKAFQESITEMQESGFMPSKDAGAAFDAGTPPVPGAKLGRDPDGNPAWYAPNPNEPGKFHKVG